MASSAQENSENQSKVGALLHFKEKTKKQESVSYCPRGRYNAIFLN